MTGKELSSMNLFRICLSLLTLTEGAFLASTASAQNNAVPVPEDVIPALEAKRVEAGKAASSSRKKLAVGAVIREAESLVQKHSAAPNRYEVLSILFRSQQTLVQLDNSSTNRKAFLTTCATCKSPRRVCRLAA